MVDDSTTLSSALPSLNRSTLAEQMTRISKFRVTRHSAVKWAQNLNFLVFEDGGEMAEKGKACLRGGSRLGDNHKDSKLGEQEEEYDNMPVLDRKKVCLRGGARLENNHQDCKLGEQDKGQDKMPVLGIEPDVDPIVNDQTKITNSSLLNTGIPAQLIDHYYPFENHNHIYDLDTNDDQRMTDYAIALSLVEDGDDQKIVNIESTTHTGQPSTGKRRADEVVEERPEDKTSCDKCQHIPTFPFTTKPRTFTVVQNIECHHYFAISYCWPKDEMGNPRKHVPTYRVRTRDRHGKLIERKNRAPDQVIDRAVQFARKRGLRMIWLDQECLPQDNSEEQELGIQAMDMVYQRAYCSLGLFESVLHHQSYLNAIASVLDWGMNDGRLLTKPPGLSRQAVARDLVSFLELLGNDQWNTRAWILQESFAADKRMMILLKTDDHIQFVAPGRVLEPPQIIAGIFNCNMNDLQRLIQISRRFLLPQKKYTAAQIYETASFEERRAENALAKLEMLQPRAAKVGSWTNFAHVKGGGRKTCNATVALTFLRTRLNYRPADRLAILANLCGYEIRLNTVNLETRFQSLSICLLTLAIVNGDLSLLNPDA